MEQLCTRSSALMVWMLTFPITVLGWWEWTKDTSQQCQAYVAIEICMKIYDVRVIMDVLVLIHPYQQISNIPRLGPSPRSRHV